MITADQLKDVLDRTEALKRYLNIDSKLIQVEEEQLRTQAPGFWDDPKKAEKQMKKVKDLQAWIDGYKQVKALADELQLAMDFYKEELVTEQEVDENYAKAISAVESLELKNMLREEADEMDCVLKINSGAGGTESQDWAQMLMRAEECMNGGNCGDDGTDGSDESTYTNSDDGTDGSDESTNDDDYDTADPNESMGEE